MASWSTGRACAIRREPRADLSAPPIARRIDAALLSNASNIGPRTVGDEIRVTKELYIAPSDLWELILSLGGVKFWIVAMAPLYIGWVLAQPTTDRHLFVNDLRVVLGLLVVGPFLGTFTLLFNTYYDMRTTDQANPRKRYVKIVEELVDPETLL